MLLSRAGTTTLFLLRAYVRFYGEAGISDLAGSKCQGGDGGPTLQIGSSIVHYWNADLEHNHNQHSVAWHDKYENITISAIGGIGSWHQRGSKGFSNVVAGLV